MTPSVAEALGLIRADKHPKSTRYGRQNPVSERWNSEEQLVAWRAAWADVSNRYLERAGREERKSLLAEKKETPFYLIPKQHELSRRITELTEDLEELKSEKDILLHSSECSDDAGISAVKKNISTMEAALKKLSQQEEKYTAELNDALQHYAELKEQAAEFASDELQDTRLALRPAMERSAVDRVQPAYGNKYDPLMMYDSKRDIANLLNEQEEKHSVREFLRQQQTAQTPQHRKEKQQER